MTKRNGHIAYFSAPAAVGEGVCAEEKDDVMRHSWLIEANWFGGVLRKEEQWSAFLDMLRDMIHIRS